VRQMWLPSAVSSGRTAHRLGQVEARKPFSQIVDQDRLNARQSTQMFHELLWRDREDGFATGQPQGVGPEAYLNGTSQGTTP